MKYITLALVASLIATNLVACGGGESQTTESKDSLEVRQVGRATASTEEIELSETFTTNLTAKVSNNISAQSGGRLRQLLVQVGDRVSQGQVVARLEATQLATAQIQLSDARLAYARMDELYKAGGVSKAEWERAKSSMDIAKETLSNIATNTELRSPISGIVTAKNYDNGDVTSPSQPIVVIEQISPVKAVINVSETHYSRLKKGIRASLGVEALGDATFGGVISNVHPTIDSRTHTVEVELEFANKDLQLRPGMYGNVRLDLGTRSALLVPDKAVQRAVGAGTRYVYVIQGGKAVYRAVELGRLIGDKQEIVSGLTEGEVVATDGSASLTNGQAVK